jgi:poly[(R)-3-hydroxyalkanoate] polymerase subunit PhaC
MMELLDEISEATSPEDVERTAQSVAGGEAVGQLDPFRLFGVYANLMDPRRVAREAPRTMAELVKVAMGTSKVAPGARDARFADPAWTEHPLYRRLMQAYLVWAESVERVASSEDGDWRDEARARYATAFVTSTLAPTNLLFGNPAALKRAFDTAGASLAQGTLNMLRDLRDNGGMPSMVDTEPFKVGENLAATPGAVVYRDEICEVLQYAPSTPSVHARPLLMVPPQINKHYFLDLAPGRSMVEYLVGRGVNYFTIVWRNPRLEHGHWGMEDYLEAQLRAVEVVCDVAGSEDLNVLGACAGGLTTGLMLGHLAHQGDERVKGATYMISMLDTRFPNILAMMATDRLESRLQEDAEAGKVYDRKDVARTFAWMRPNDLVFNYVVNNWLMGKDPPAFDILAWNEDSTNLSARFDRDMLDIFAHNRAARPGGVTVLGSPIDLSKVTCDTYVVAGKTDHITPWQPCYMTTQLVGGRSEVIITSTGHIQTIVNPPGKPRARYYAGPEPGPDPEVWMAEADEHQGSWWPRYADWLLERSGPARRPRAKLGSRKYPAGDPAPGRYVHES